MFSTSNTLNSAKPKLEAYSKVLYICSTQGEKEHKFPPFLIKALILSIANSGCGKSKKTASTF